MVVTIFGDVHGNLIALEKLFKIENETTDYFVSHGDVVNYGPWSNECVQYLNSLTNCKLLKGNHEQYYLNGCYNGTNKIANSFFNFCYNQFDLKLLSSLHAFEDKIIIGDFVIQHTIDDKYVFFDTCLENFNLETNYVIGHSHQQYFRNFENKKLINTGSLGQNRQYLNQSCYIKIDTISNKIELKSYLFDLEKVINHMKSYNYPKLCLDYYNSKQSIII